MPVRHRHDEFLWALIFSLSINLLIVYALVMQQTAKNGARVPAIIVSIETPRSDIHRQSFTTSKVQTAAASTTARTAEAKTPPLPVAPLVNIKKPLLPLERVNAIAHLPVAASEPKRTGGGDGLPLPTAERETTSSPPVGESAQALDAVAKGSYTEPQRTTGDDPPYPEWAKRRGWEGTVLLKLLINAKGEVDKVGIVKTSGHELLDRSACNAVASWGFQPARRNGLAIAVEVHLPIIFRLPSPETPR